MTTPNPFADAMLQDKPAISAAATAAGAGGIAPGAALGASQDNDDPTAPETPSPAAAAVGFAAASAAAVAEAPMEVRSQLEFRDKQVAVLGKDNRDVKHANKELKRRVKALLSEREEMEAAAAKMEERLESGSRAEQSLQDQVERMAAGAYARPLFSFSSPSAVFVTASTNTSHNAQVQPKIGRV
jgi:hypothetical protein